ncbi:MAG: response regulator [Proteobacteria bacterium]|nr:response regulator [Pseudomonadota bacterium]
MPTDTQSFSLAPVSLTVLVVDDDQTTLELVRAVLETEGHKVLTWNRPFGTTQLVLRHRPDVILLDVRMPGLNGVELAKLVNARHRAPQCVILHSSVSEVELYRLGQEAGVVGAIPKTDNVAAFLEDFRRLTHQCRCGRRARREA